MALLFTNHHATWESMGKQLIIMEREVAHIRMDKLTCICLLLYHFPLILIAFLFLATDAQATFEVYVEHLVASATSNWIFRFQTISS
jgi:hypothetical protein